VQIFPADKHSRDVAGSPHEEMRVTMRRERACCCPLEGPCYPTLRTVFVYPTGLFRRSPDLPQRAKVAPPPARLMGESWGDGVVWNCGTTRSVGRANPADGENVVLHEFAHQLDAEDGVTDGAPILPRAPLRTWGGVLSEEYERLRRDAAHDRGSWLDDYGATNKASFSRADGDLLREAGSAPARASRAVRQPAAVLPAGSCARGRQKAP